jgi:hypothetical protein
MTFLMHAGRIHGRLHIQRVNGAASLQHLLIHLSFERKAQTLSWPESPWATAKNSTADHAATWKTRHVHKVLDANCRT